MDRQLVYDTVTYLGMIFATVVVFGSVMWAAAATCRASGRGRRCIVLVSLAASLIGLVIWSNVMDVVVPGQEYLGPWWWLAFIALPAILSTAASLVILVRGPDRKWRAMEHVRAAFGAMLCGLLGLVLVWQQTDNVWGWATAMSGCGPARGTVDWLSNREAYRRLWWGDPQAWYTTKCGGELDARMAAEGAAGGTPPTDSDSDERSLTPVTSPVP